MKNKNWREKFYEEKDFIIPNGGDIKEVKITQQDWDWIEKFIDDLVK